MSAPGTIARGEQEDRPNDFDCRALVREEVAGATVNGNPTQRG